MGKRKAASSSQNGVGNDGGTSNSEDEEAGEAKPVGEFVKKAGRGKGLVKFYKAFELDGIIYELDETVLVSPETPAQKPYVAMIKEIKQTNDGSMAIVGQWFYRPEEAEKSVGGYYSLPDARELFYSFHLDEVPVESVMHKCVVHFIPSNKQLPDQSKYPGHVVRKVYDAAEKRLWRLTDRDYEDSKQQEIEQLMKKTRDYLGELPNIDPVPDQQVKEGPAARLKKRKNLAALRIEREDNKAEVKSNDDVGKTLDTPKTPAQSEIHGILHSSNVLVGNQSRNKWLEKLLQAVKYVCDVEGIDQPTEISNSPGGVQKAETCREQKAKGAIEHSLEQKVLPGDDQEVEVVEQKSEIGKGQTVESGDQKADQVETVKSVEEKVKVKSIPWPDPAVAAVSALERCAYEVLGSEMHKYNLKMRSLTFNLKNSPTLARRLLLKELEPMTVINMSATDLKEGLTSTEKTPKEPSQPKAMQMTDLRCAICGEHEVGVKDVIHRGHGDRYQMECMKCGNSWYTSTDAISSLTIEISRSPTVGTAPWATSKFEDLPSKETFSPRDSSEGASAHANVEAPADRTVD